MQTNKALRFANRLFVALLAAVILVWTGCDSSEDKNEDDDAARFVGTWDAVSLTAGPLNVLGDLEMVVTFQSNGNVQIVVSDDTGELENVTGRWDVDTSKGELRLSSVEFDEDLDMSYNFDTDTKLKLTFSGSDLETLGFDLGELGGIVGGLSLTATLDKRI